MHLSSFSVIVNSLLHLGHNMSDLEVKVLTLIINEIGHLTIRRDTKYYRLQLIINSKDFGAYTIKEIIDQAKYKPYDFVFNYDNSNGRYYIYGTGVIRLLELINNELLSGSRSLLKNRAYEVMQHKELFTRSKGKKLTEEELNTLEQLHQQFSAK